MTTSVLRRVVMVIVAACGVTVAAQAQQAATREPQIGDFRLKSVRTLLQQSPNSGGGAADFVRPATLFRDWLRIEVQFETKVDWADGVKLVYYALYGAKTKDPKLFKGEVIHNYVNKGSQHFSGMFMHPNLVRRCGGGIPQMVAVQLYFRDRLFDQVSDPASNQRWWELMTPQPEALLTPVQTPWGILSHDHYEAVPLQQRSP